jgi:hypothetical protein
MAIVAVVLAAAATPLWAADVSGTWQGQLVIGQAQNSHLILLRLKAEGAALTGTISFCRSDCSSINGTIPIENGKVDGDSISFSFPTGTQDVPHMDLQGTVKDDSIQFVVSGNAQDCMAASCEIGKGNVTRAK